ncbi:MAG: acyl-CoA dehydrogenase family protein, partial [Gammaproteobacteria bacterium]|nr:acyl-CoA dehydrogenase family protein [Gammaproteobacteria bacterium]
MDIELSAEDLAFREEVRGFFADNAYSSGDYNKWRMEWFDKAAEKGGWDVPKWPVEFGGPGWSPTQHYIWEQETAVATLPWDMPFGIGMLAPILMGYGNKEQQDRFLPDIRARKVNWCQGYSEPGAGSDLASLKTKATLSADGSHYTVNGTKIWTTMAHIADWIFCLTRTDDSGRKQEGITFLLFPMKQDGIEVKPIITLGGAHSVNSVFFTDVEVPVENRIGEEGKGWTYAKGLLQHERTGLAGISRSIVALENLKTQAAGVKRGNGSLMDEPAY